MTINEAHYSVSVDMRGDDPVVKVFHQGRLIAIRTVHTVGNAMRLGGLLIDPETPKRPTITTEQKNK